MTENYLMLHQKEGIEFLKNTWRCLLADEAGLGKTRQVLEAAKKCVGYRKMLVICPTSIINNWYAEADKWGFDKEKMHVVGLEAGFLKQIEELKKGKWSIIVVDESHNFRNLTAQRTKEFIKLIKGRDSRIWFMSGTPIVKGANDLFVTVSVCEPGKHGKYKEFQENYCNKKVNQWKPGGYEYYGVRKQSLKILNAHLNRIMIRRYKKDCLDDLPAKLISEIPLEVECRNFDIFTSDGIIRAVTKAVESGGTIQLSHEHAETVQELGLKKIPYVVQFIKDIIYPNPCVVFAHHRLVLFEIAERLRDIGRKVHVIIGSMDKDLKFKYIKEFQKGIVDDLVVGVLAGGTGHNLYRGSKCVFAEFPWTWAAMEQAEDRLHRIGQLDCVNVYRCYAKDTFEERQLNMINERKEFTKDVVGLK